MADLDSFFAKKDKKKVKGKKFTTTDEIARRLEETEKKDHMQTSKPKLEPLKKAEPEPGTGDDKEQGQVTGTPAQQIQHKAGGGGELAEEEEWNDFKDEADKDLTDLKISKLQIEDEDDGCIGGSGDDDADKDGNKDKKDGVWKTENTNVQQTQQQQQVQAPAPEPEEKVVVNSRSQGGSSYVPPHMRNMAPSPLPKNTPRRNKTAPDINNEMAFPSLSDAQQSNPMGAWGKKKFNMEGFESVKHGSSRNVQEDFGGAPKLSTANRFDALSDNS